MIEFRASHIESFRKYLNDDISKQMMLDSLQGKTTPSVKMQIGTMYHELIQSKGKTSDLFNMNQVQEAQNRILLLNMVLYQYQGLQIILLVIL